MSRVTRNPCLQGACEMELAQQGDSSATASIWAVQVAPRLPLCALAFGVSGSQVFGVCGGVVVSVCARVWLMGTAPCLHPPAVYLRCYGVSMHDEYILVRSSPAVHGCCRASLLYSMSAVVQCLPAVQHVCCRANLATPCLPYLLATPCLPHPACHTLLCTLSRMPPNSHACPKQPLCRLRLRSW